MTTTSGLVWLMRATALARHVSQVVFGRLFSWSQNVISGAGHPGRTSSTSFQCARFAASSSAGNHMPAWESPSSTTVLAPFGSPYTHGGLVVVEPLTSHP